MPGATNNNNKVEVTNIMRALEPEVVNVLWQSIEPLLPAPDRSHPLGCHRPRVPDKLCFRGILIRLVTGSSWVDIEAILDHKVSDTTLRARRDEWIAAGIFERLKDEAMAGFDQIIDPEPEHLRGGPGAQHVGVIDVRTARQDRGHQRADLAARRSSTDPTDQTDRRVHQGLKTEAGHQRGRHDQPGVGHQVRVIEGRVDPVDPVR